MIPRLIENNLLTTLESQKKIVLLFGARQVGKTTFVKKIEEEWQKKDKKTLYLNCDLQEDLKVINTTSLTLLRQLTNGLDLLLIDEAQRLDDAGLTLKILYDELPSVRVLATGSSSFELKNKSVESLSARYLDFSLYPFSLKEVLKQEKPENLLLKTKADNLINQVLTFGFYPEVFLLPTQAAKVVLLDKIIESYLFKDIFTFEKVRNSQAIKNLTQALAYQVGSEVNENELAGRLKIDRKTVVSYLDLLEKAYIIIRLYPFSRNPRREIGRNYKIYFTDLGIRNALIGDFNPLEVRNDIGALWENFLITERLKKYASSNQKIEINFWRSYQGAEVDYLERSFNKPNFQAFEFKYGVGSIGKGAKSFQRYYNFPLKLINKENYWEFI